MTEPVLTECPDCDVEGVDVYVADAHPTSCSWMMRNIRRCHQHDELLRPDETTCPHPEVPEEDADPHRRHGA